MRYLIFAVLALPFTSCFPVKPLPEDVPLVQAAALREAPPVAAPAPEPPRVVVREIYGITFEGVAFDSRDHRLVVADQAGGPGSRFVDSAAAARSVGGIAAVNAGFFTPEGDPLGLVVAAGKISGSWNTASSLGSGAWFESRSEKSAIARRGTISRAEASAMRELIQAGPLLVENRRAVSGLEATKSSVRMLILWDGGTRWWIGRGSPCTLAALGQSLATSPPAGWPVRQALNLDGGRSSDLWISETVAGGPLLRRQPWNRPVRNFLMLVAR
jgi:hypothetical protein